jgi:hypothetical protein
MWPNVAYLPKNVRELRRIITDAKRAQGLQREDFRKQSRTLADAPETSVTQEVVGSSPISVAIRKPASYEAMRAFS